MIILFVHAAFVDGTFASDSFCHVKKEMGTTLLVETVPFTQFVTH